MKKLLSWFALVAVIVTGCQSSPATTQQGPTGPTKVVVRLLADWSYDVFAPPQYTLGGFEFGYAGYDSLLAYEPGTWKLIPYVAKEWSVTPTSVTFKLRDDVTCNDGTKLTPTAVANFFKWKVADPGRITIQPSVANLGPYTITADDAAGTFTFATTVPKATLVNALGTTWLLCPAGITADPKERAVKYFGTGPYQIVDYVVGDSISFKKRADWKWGPQGATAKDLPDELVFRVVANNTTAANLFTTGQLDVGPMSGPDLARLESDPNLTVHTWPTYNVVTLQFNQYPESVFSDVNLRKAVMTAIDPKAYDKAANDGRGVVSTATVPKSHPCYNPATEQLAPTPSIPAAKAVLQQAGYTLGSDGKLQKGGKALPTVRIVGAQTTNKAPDYFGAVLDELGFKTEVFNLALSDWAARIRAVAYDIQGPSTTGSGGNPTALGGGYIETEREGGPKNQLSSTVMDPEAHKIYHELDEGLLPLDQRCAELKRFQELVWKNWWALPLSTVPSYSISRKEKGITFMEEYNGFGLVAIYSLRARK